MLVAIDEDILYAINKDTKLVEYRLTNTSLMKFYYLFLQVLVITNN